MKLNNLIKVIISLALVVIMICLLAIPTFAVDDIQTGISPRWNSIAMMDVSMAFVGNAGNAVGMAIKHSTASHIVGALYLYKWNGSTYEYMDDVWGSKSVGSLGLSIDFVAEVGVQYKAVFTVVAYTDGVGEDHTIVYYETCK